MITAFPTCEIKMDISHVHDKMEIANSPYPQVDDIDLDFDNVRQQSIDRSMADDADIMQADIADMYNDDDMLDDEALQPSENDQNDLEDLNMEAFDQDDQILDDDAVEEAASVDMAEQDFTLTETLISQIENDEHSSRAIEESELHAYGKHSDDNTNTAEIDQKNIHNQNITVDPEEHLPDGEEDQDPTNPIDVVDFAEPEHDDVQDHQLTKAQLPLTEDEQLPGVGLQDAHDSSLVAEAQQSQPLESSINTADEVTTHEDPVGDATRLSVPIEQNGTSIQAAESLHPITIVYLGQEMSLFPPMVDDSSATFFVSDTSLANEPVEILLAACREILGQSLEHDDELVLDIPTLGLHICEDSDFAAQLTLLRILEVYIALCRNESAENIDPLYCSLSSRVCLASQFAYLERSAADGKTFSEIAAEHADSPEQEVDALEEQFKESDVDEVENPVQPEHEEADTKDHSGLSDNQSLTHAIEDTQSINNTDVNAPEIHEGTLDGHKDAITQLDAQSKASDEGLVQQEATGEANEEAVWQPLEPGAEQTNEIGEHDEDEADDQGQDVDSGDNDTQHIENVSSTSSHTIEGEDGLPSPAQEINPEHVNTVSHGFEHNVNEDQDEFENLETAEDLFSEDAENNASTEYQDDEDAQTEAKKDVTSLSLEPAQAHSSNEATDYDQPKLDELSTEEAFVFGADEDTEEFDFLGVDDATSVPPVTPSKMYGGKRKAFEDEEELDFNEISTPEPKRTRAS